MAYRKRIGSDTWHFCKNCSNWPTAGYKTSGQKPKSGEYCNECRAKRAKGECKK